MLVNLQGVSKQYFQPTPVLDHIELQLKQGDFLYVVGDSGAGKSSLLRMMTTEENPSSGTVSLFGYDLKKASGSTLRAIRQSIGYVPQNVQLFSDLTVFENIVISLRLSNRKLSRSEQESRIHHYLEKLGLHQKRNDLGSTLSGGEAQRVAVIRALVRQPDLIVADEPTGAQDREHTWALMEQFVIANRAGASVVLATHDREIVRKVRKRCAILNQGKLSIEDLRCIY